LNATLARLNTWWKQRAKVKWMMNGDSNSKFFLSFASTINISNWIFKMQDESGSLVEDQNLIENKSI